MPMSGVHNTYGHEAGDRVLIGFAGRLREALRVGDALVRWGGEEFVAIMPGATTRSAVRRLEQVMRERTVSKPDGAPLTFSAGVASSGGMRRSPPRPWWRSPTGACTKPRPPVPPRWLGRMKSPLRGELFCGAGLLSCGKAETMSGIRCRRGR